MCTSEATLAHNLGAQHFDDVMSYNSLTTLVFFVGNKARHTFLVIYECYRKDWEIKALESMTNKFELKLVNAGSRPRFLLHLFLQQKSDTHLKWVTDVFFSVPKFF